jgi:pimeloyl-ACP methyl ester carboxylesterase
LVHGVFADESAWGFVRNDLAKNVNIIVVNLPAHGADNTFGANVELNDYVQTVTKAVNNAPSKVILLGHSMAGAIISQVAENVPNKIDKLVYVAAYLPKNGESIQSLNNGFYGKKLLTFLSLIKTILIINKERCFTNSSLC